jgi:hypothetical protein
MPRFLHRLLAPAGPKARSSPLSRVRRPRPRIEALEDRMNPAGLTFVPFSVLAVNPQPLPPSALVQFNPLPDVNNLPSTPGSFQNPIAFQGSFQQTITPSPSTTTAGKLTINFSLKGSVSGTVMPPTAAGPGTFTAMYTITGTATETIYLPGTTILSQYPWAISTAITESGTVSGPLNAASSTAIVTDPMTFSATIGLKQTEYSVNPFGIPTVPWYIDAQVQAAGQFQVVVPPPGPTVVPDSVAATFAVQDGIDESLSTPAANPLPPYKILATDNGAGSVAETVYPLSPTAGPSGPSIMPSYVTGKTQYHEDLAETITNPTGGTQNVSEAFDTTGLFQYGQLFLAPMMLEPDVATSAV